MSFDDVINFAGSSLAKYEQGTSESLEDFTTIICSNSNSKIKYFPCPVCFLMQNLLQNLGPVQIVNEVDVYYLENEF